jgi:dihydrofolate reductase (trimethoprim resistance protein)
MHISFIVARSRNNVIGRGPEIPWRVEGEQLLFKALTFNQWVLVGRKTYETIAHLSNRKFAVLTRSVPSTTYTDNTYFFPSIETALEKLGSHTDRVIIAGGGSIFSSLIDKADSMHISTLNITVEGDIYFPDIPTGFEEVFYQDYASNINWRYSLYVRRVKSE